MRAGVRRLLVVAPTGSGKTVLAVRMLGGAVSKGMRALFIVHRRELVKQSVEAFNAGGVPCGTISAGFPYQPGLPVYVASIQTMIRRLHTLGDVNLCIWDEAHHLSASSWHRAFSYLKDSWHIGLSATPARTDRKGLNRYFDEMVMGPSVHELIDLGFLSQYDYYSVDLNISLDNIKMIAGDYSKPALSELMDQPTITNRAVDEYIRLADGKKFLVFAVSVQHSNHIVEQFLSHGITAKHVDANTHQNERDEAIKALSEGRINILSNVGLFGEGVDLPSLDGISILRPTMSLSLYLQMCGRCLRPYPGKKKAIIIDHVKNVYKHNYPCADRRKKWSLEEDKIKPKAPSIIICGNCCLAVSPGVFKCPQCGEVVSPGVSEEKKEREMVPEVEGEIVKLDPKHQKINRLREQADAEDYESLVKLGQRRGYKKPKRWAMHLMRARNAKKS